MHNRANVRNARGTATEIPDHGDLPLVTIYCNPNILLQKLSMKANPFIKTFRDKTFQHNASWYT
ncbi:hypothetical protein QTP88_004316 [Uroleucon formosanum]